MLCLRRPEEIAQTLDFIISSLSIPTPKLFDYNKDQGFTSIPCIGAKAAAVLEQRFGTVKNLLRNIQSNSEKWTSFQKEHVRAANSLK